MWLHAATDVIDKAERLMVLSSGELAHCLGRGYFITFREA